MVNFVSVKQREEQIYKSFMESKIRKYVEQFEDYITTHEVNELYNTIYQMCSKSKNIEHDLCEYTNSLLKNIDIIDENWEHMPY